LTQNTFFDLIRRNAVEIYSEEGLKKRLALGKSLKIKLGADPSRPDLHLGHTVPLRMLRRMQDAGHEIIFVIGDFTGMIGDPTGKSKTRIPLTFEQTRRNGQSYFEQVTKILDPAKTRITYNSQWLSALNFADVLALTAKYTLARILERDDFAGRFVNNQAIGLHELLYPLMQGYDSVALEADIEVGGTDQTFNLLVGRALQKDYGQEPQEVITFPLLPGLDGKEKMSKSLDNYIGIDEPADTMFEKCMRVPDEVLPQYFRLTTDLPEPSYEEPLRQDMPEAHRVYAREIVRLYHGEEAVTAAEQRYSDVAKGAVPESIPNITFPVGQTVPLIDLLKQAGFAASNSEARRLIEGKGIQLNGEVVTDIYCVISENSTLRRGKNRFLQVIFK
jgi:tyrosyl-tRNA synthetase